LRPNYDGLRYVGKGSIKGAQPSSATSPTSPFLPKLEVISIIIILRPLHNYFERQLWTFWGTHPGEANGPLWRVNPELLEAVRPSLALRLRLMA
ncbi:MAG: hypothetical protein V3V47_04645, partial [Desulfobacteria bacterium]